MISKNYKFSAGVISTALLLATPMCAYSTNGYFLIGYGAKSRAMGGVGVAEGVDSYAAAVNPATMGDVGTRFDIGFDIFKPDFKVAHSDGTLSETVIREDGTSPSFAFAKDGIYLLPNMGFIYGLNDKITLGFAMVGNGAASQYDQSLPPGNTSYFFNFNGLGGDDVLGVELIQVQMLPSIAYKLNKQHSFGASLALGFQTFRARGLGAFEQLNLGATTDNLTNQGRDTSYGAGIRLGWQGKFMNDKVVLGVNYSSKVYMTKFDKYKNLFAEQGDFDIPENYAIGVAITPQPGMKVKFDIQRTNYSNVHSIGNPGPNVNDTTDFNPLCPGVDPVACKLGGDLGMGFGWEDQTVYKLGFSYLYNDKLELRTGLNYGKSPIPEDQVLFNLLAPAVVEWHLTLGATYAWDKDIEISAAYVHAFENTVAGPTIFQSNGADPNNPVNNATLSMVQNSISANLGIRF